MTPTAGSAMPTSKAQGPILGGYNGNGSAPSDRGEA